MQADCTSVESGESLQTTFPKCRTTGFDIPESVDLAWLLLWYAGGRLRFISSRSDFVVSCDELGMDAVPIEAGLLNEPNPGTESIDLKAEPGFSPGGEASVQVSLPDLVFNPDVILEGTPAELSIIRDGIDLFDRIVCSRGTMRGIAWDAQIAEPEDNEAADDLIYAVSGSIQSDPVVDSGTLPTARVTKAAWPDTVPENPVLYRDGVPVGRIWLEDDNAARDSWRDKPYPIWYGSGNVFRVQVVPCDYEYYDEGSSVVEFMYYVLREGHIAADAEIDVIEKWDEDAGAFVAVEVADIPREIVMTTDSIGRAVTLMKLTLGLLDQAYATGSDQLYVTVSWTRRSSDTLGGAVSDLLSKYGQMSAPVDFEAMNALDSEFPGLRFDLQINSDTTALSVLSDRIVHQVASVVCERAGALSLFTLPRELRPGGPVLRDGTEIAEITDPPSETSIDNIVNTFEIRWGRSPKSGGDSTMFFRETGDDDGPLVSAPDLPRVHMRTGDPPSARSSRTAYGARLMELSCPDLVDRLDVEGVADRIVRWFSFPVLQLSARLIPKFNTLQAGDIVRVTSRAWSFDEAPFMVTAITRDPSGPSVALWGGREIR